MKIYEQLAIIKAYINKIPIEVKHRLSTNKWKDLIYTNDYYFNFYEYEYRIKEEPEYRPYKTIEEAFNEAKKHEFWTKEISTGFIINVGAFGENFEDIYINGYNQNNFLDKFVWADDNSPCGIKIE